MIRTPHVWRSGRAGIEMAALLLLTVSVAPGGLAMAQESEVPTQKYGSGRAAQSAEPLEEIIVTAQKQRENAQDVPKSVAVASQATLEAEGVSRLSDLADVFPSVTVSNGLFQNSKPPGIRGVSSFANAVSVQAQTGIIVDDIPQPTFSTLANELSDVERVEVFAGPQSTLSGRNAAAGIINIVTRGPSRAPAADFLVEQTTDRQTRVTAFGTGPIADTLAFSLSGVYNKWAGPLRDIALNDTHLGGFDTKGIRGKLLWAPTERFTATLTGYYLATDRVTPPLLGGGAYIDVNPGATHAFDAATPKRTFNQLYPGVTAAPGNRDIYSLENGSAKTRDRGIVVRADYDLNALGTISSLTSYSRSEQPRTDVFIGAPRTDLVLNLTDFDATTDVATKYVSEELRLVSTGNQTFTYLLGTIYTDSDLSEPYKRLQVFPVNWDRTSRIKSFAAFARGTYDLTEANSVTAGLRYQNDRLGYTWQFNPIRPTDPNTYSHGDSSYGFLAGEASFKHKFSSDVNAYLTLSHSETGKAYDVEDNADASNPNTPLKPLNSEKVNNVELGLKSQLFDRRLTLNFDVFKADYKDYQIQTGSTGCPTCVPVIRLLSIGQVRTQGIELASTFRANDSLHLGLSALYNDAQIRDYPNASCYTGQTAAQGCMPATSTTLANQGNLRGLSLQAAPKYKVNASTDYRLPLDLSRFDASVGGVYSYQSSSRFDTYGDPLVVQGGFAVVNLYARLESKEGRYGVDLYVNNLFNKTFYDNIFHEALINARSVIYDRNSFRYGGVRFTAKF